MLSQTPTASRYVVDPEELVALARAVALDPDLEVFVGAPGVGWSIQSETGHIRIDGGDMASRTADDLRGLICHEAAHAAVTRYPHLVPADILARPGVASLLNALEDCRIEDWLASRFPGVRPWIALYNDRLFPIDGAGLGDQPFFRQFCLGAIHEWWHGELPPTLHEVPRQALLDTAHARGAVIGCQPPVTADLSALEVMAYDRGPVAGLFRRRDAWSPPDGFECLVRLAAYDAWRRTWLEIWPTYEALVRADQARGRDLKQEERQLLVVLRGMRGAPPIRGRRRRGLTLPPGLLSTLLPGAAPPDAPEGEPADGVTELPPHVQAALDRLTDPIDTNTYEEARRDVMPLADRMVAELERVLRPTSYPRWISGHASGSRLDLRVAMRLPTEPGAYTRMWQRKTLPVKREPAFLLLLDLSGSMGGAPIHNCFRGTVLVAEVLERLQIPFAVYGFQDRLIPFKTFATPLDAATRRRMGEMPLEVEGRRPGGCNRPQHNYDGPVLDAAADILDGYPGHPRILLSVSDGEPSGPADAQGALHRAVARVVAQTDIHLLGVGLGPGTDHVAHFYPNHAADLPIEHFPEVLGRLVDDLITPARHSRSPR